MSDFSFKDVKQRKKPNQQSVDIVTDGFLARQIADLVKEYNLQKIRDQRLNEPDKAPEIAKQIEALRDEAEESTFTFIFQDIGRKRFEEMQDEYPPTDEQKEEGYIYDPAGFAPQLIHETNVQPGLTLEEAREIWDTWGSGEVNALFGAAVGACAEKASVPFIGTSFQQTQTSGSKSNTVTTTESPTPITLAGNKGGQETTEL